MTIDKKDFKPYYIQIKEELKSRIAKGIYGGKGMLPSENTLAEEFKVTRLTVRNAIKELKTEGLVYTQKGKGIFISQPIIEQSLLKFYSFGRDYGKTEPNARTKLLSFTKIAPSGELMEALKLVDEGVLEIIRLRFINDIPLILEKSYIPLRYCNKIESYNLEDNSLYDIIEEINKIKILKAKETLEPAVTDKYTSAVLELPIRYPVFCTERLTFISEDEPIEMRISIIRGDKFKFSVELK